MKEQILMAHADAACDALLAREYLVRAMHDYNPSFWADRAKELLRYAHEFSHEAEKLERKHGSVFPGVRQ